MASERPGSSLCFDDQASTFDKNSSESRIARTGSRPVAGRPPLLGFGNTVLDFGMFWYYHIGEPRGRVQSSAPALTRAIKDANPMTQADRVHSTPPTNSSANNPPGPLTRRGGTCSPLRPAAPLPLRSPPLFWRPRPRSIRSMRRSSGTRILRKRLMRFGRFAVVAKILGP